VRFHALLAVMFFALCSLAAASLPITQEIEEALTCQCGCGLTVHTCNHLQCGFAVPAKQEIAKQVGEGKKQEEIVATFLTRYGEKVLSAPTTTGFNLAAWITPFLVVLIGGVLIGIVGLRWNKSRRQNEPQKPIVSSEAEQYREQLKKELENFEN